MNVGQAHNLSKSFATAFERCREARPLPGGQFQWPMVPTIVCAAFSIEIGFKAIILTEGNSASGHELAALFKKISPAMQLSIIQKVGLDSQAFNLALELVSGAFTEWRYIYEQDSAQINFEFLTKLMNATQEATASCRK